MGLSTLALNNDPTAYNEPRKFKPERFLADSEEFFIPGTKQKRHHLQFIPFSTGIRACAGQSIAMAETKFLTIPILLATDFQPKKLENEDAQFTLGTTARLHGKVARNDYYKE